MRKALASLGVSLARELSGSVRCESWLSRIDPRVKILGVIAIIIAATSMQGLLPLAVLPVALVTLAFSARVGVGRLVRVSLGVPLFSLAIILPATTDLVTPGHPVLTLFGHIRITQSGLVVAGRFLLRSIDCVTPAFLLVATTGNAALLNGLRRLGMPRAFGMTLAMTQRYLAVLLRAAEEIHLAKLSRTIDAGPTREEQRWVAAGIGGLFRRTHRLAQEVHLAMVARGFRG